MQWTVKELCYTVLELKAIVATDTGFSYTHCTSEKLNLTVLEKINSRIM